MDGVSDKSSVAYIILGIFLGGLGIHNFYAGYTKKGIIQLLITVLSAGFLGWITFIWSIIDICTVKTDAQGRKFQ